MVESVYDFLVQQQVANDILIYGEAKDELLEQFPQMKYKSFRKQNPAVAEAWKTIEKYCSVEEMIHNEKRCFAYDGPPEISEDAFYKIFCKQLRSDLERRVKADGIDLNDDEAMTGAWEKSLVVAADEYNSLSSQNGVKRIEQAYALITTNYVLGNPLVYQFTKKIIDKELEHLTETYKRVKGAEE